MLGSGPAFEIAGLTLGMREGLIGLIVLVACYMAFEVLRMRRLRRQAAQPVASAKKPEPTINVSDEDDDLPAPKRSAEPLWERSPPAQVDAALRQTMQQELQQLRDEVDSIRGELAGLRADMLQELALMRAAQTVSPIYGDAMQMAMSGYDASLIAERCGIARAEAELVLALAKSQNT